MTSLDTAGVLGETYLEIESAQAVGVPVQDGDTLPTQVHPDFNQVVRASQGTLENMDALLKRADRILAFAESGKGSLGKLIYDPIAVQPPLRHGRGIAEDRGAGGQRARQPGRADQPQRCLR